MKIRVVKMEDSPQILDIYAPFIRDTVVTFENEVPTLADFETRIRHYLEFFPWLVAEVDGRIAGYAYASKYRDRIAYQWVCECSIYMHPDFKKKGIATQLYRSLFEILQLQGMYRVYAVIGVPNEESTLFHEKCGFKFFAGYKSTGYKMNQWRDTGWWELVLKEPDAHPQPPVFWPQLNPAEVEAVLNHYNQSE